MPQECLRNEYIKCGKKNCKSCPHGPYWYAYWWAEGKTHKRYIGKIKPAERKVPDRLDEIFKRSTATMALACEILGIRITCTESELRTAFRKQTLLHHPDRGGTHEAMSRINAAYAKIKDLKGWI